VAIAVDSHGRRRKMIIGLLAAIIAAVAIGSAVAILTAVTVLGWIDENKIPSAKTAEIIKCKLGNGEYKVVTGIYSTKKNMVCSNEWIAEELDYELQSKFRNGNKVRIKI